MGAPPQVRRHHGDLPAGIVAGETRSIMCAPNGAVPPIILVIPMSASVTLTMRPGNDPGAEQVVCAKR
ncbi:MAG: hypothetical protein WBP81_02570 [Solirubrobacteraceae bacterium]